MRRGLKVVGFDEIIAWQSGRRIFPDEEGTESDLGMAPAILPAMSQNLPR